MIPYLARSRLPRSVSPCGAQVHAAVESSTASHGVVCYSLGCRLCQQGLRMTKTPTSLLERLRGSFDPEAWDRDVLQRRRHALHAGLGPAWAKQKDTA